MGGHIVTLLFKTVLWHVSLRKNTLSLCHLSICTLLRSASFFLHEVQNSACLDLLVFCKTAIHAHVYYITKNISKSLSKARRIFLHFCFAFYSRSSIRKVFGLIFVLVIKTCVELSH